MFGQQLLRLQFGPHPDSISLRCLNDSYWAFYLQLRSPKVCDFSSLINLLTRPLLLSSAAVTTIVPPASQGDWNTPSPNPKGTMTEIDNIFSAVHQVDQKSGAANTPPVPNTAVTAIDDSLTTAGLDGNSAADPPGYELVFGPTNSANNAPGVSFIYFLFLLCFIDYFV